MGREIAKGEGGGPERLQIAQNRKKGTGLVSLWDGSGRDRDRAGRSGIVFRCLGRPALHRRVSTGRSRPMAGRCGSLCRVGIRCERRAKRRRGIVVWAPWSVCAAILVLQRDGSCLARGSEGTDWRGRLARAIYRIIEKLAGNRGTTASDRGTRERGNEGTRGASEGTKKSMGSKQHVQYMRDGCMKRIVSL